MGTSYTLPLAVRAPRLRLTLRRVALREGMIDARNMEPAGAIGRWARKALRVVRGLAGSPCDALSLLLSPSQVGRIKCHAAHEGPAGCLACNKLRFVHVRGPESARHTVGAQ